MEDMERGEIEGQGVETGLGEREAGDKEVEMG